MRGKLRTRRDFAMSLGALAALPLSGGAEAGAAPPATPAEAYVEIIRLRCGARLSAAQLRRIQQRIEATLAGSARLRRFPLPAGAEPDLSFSADVP